MCGISVCGDCSNKKINKNRACDLCFLRVESQDLIQRKEKVLDMKDVNCIEIEKMKKEINEKIESCEKEISNYQFKKQNEEEKNIMSLEEMKCELRETAGVLKRKKEIMENFDKNLKNEETLLKSKQNDFDRYRKEIGKMKEDILRKNFHMNHGNEELKELIDQIKKTQTTV